MNKFIESSRYFFKLYVKFIKSYRVEQMLEKYISIK